MDDWTLEDEWEWDEEEDVEDFLYELSHELADRFFLSDNTYLPNALEKYQLGYLDPEDWWPLVNQLSEIADLETIIEVAPDLDESLGLPGLPTELLEDPYVFLQSVLAGDLPLEPSGRRVSSRKLVRIAHLALEIISDFPETARSAMRAWADIHRGMMLPPDFDLYDDDDFSDLLFPPDLPPAMTGFSMMIALTLMHWPKRAEGLPLPADFEDPDLYEQVLEQWEALPDSPSVTEEGTGEAEAFFAQGQLAHMLAQMGAVELLAADEVEEGDIGLAYSRLSRAILWIHDQCRHCPERQEVACKAATGWHEGPVPLLDIAGEIANTGRVEGCIKM